MIRTDLIPGVDVWLSVISARRPQNVVPMTEKIGRATWYISPDDFEMYLDVPTCITADLPHARNAALNDAFVRQLPCIQISDDLKELFVLQEGMPGRWAHCDRVSFATFVGLLWDSIGRVPNAHLAGVNPAANPFHCDVSNPIKTEHFCLGDFFLATPSTPRFAHALRLKEDYDFTAKHIQTYGAVARNGRAIAVFSHRENKGGAVDYRTSRREQQSIAYLQERWGTDVFKENIKRPNEVLMRGQHIRRKGI